VATTLCVLVSITDTESEYELLTNALGVQTAEAVLGPVVASGAGATPASPSTSAASRPVPRAGLFTPLSAEVELREPELLPASIGVRTGLLVCVPPALGEALVGLSPPVDGSESDELGSAPLGDVAESAQPALTDSASAKSRRETLPRILRKCQGIRVLRLSNKSEGYSAPLFLRFCGSRPTMNIGGPTNVLIHSNREDAIDN
jgi:hypothetical protein